MFASVVMFLMNVGLELEEGLSGNSLAEVIGVDLLNGAFGVVRVKGAYGVRQGLGWVMIEVLILMEVSVERGDEVPVVVEFLFAEFDGVNRDVYFKLGHGVLQDSEVDCVFVFRFWVLDDSVDDYRSWEIVVYDPTVYRAFSKFFDLGVGSSIAKKMMDPKENGLS